MNDTERARLDALEQTNGTHWKRGTRHAPAPASDEQAERGDERDADVHDRAARLEREAVGGSRADAGAGLPTYQPPPGEWVEHPTFGRVFEPSESPREDAANRRVQRLG
jgi:hypothetical protein